MDRRSRCTLVRPIAGLSSPLLVAILAAMVAACIALRSEEVALVFIPVMALAFMLIALVAAVLVNLAEVPVVVGVDGVMLGAKRFVAFADLSALDVEGDRLTLVSGGRTERLYLRPGALPRGILRTLAALMKLQRYRSLLPAKEEDASMASEVARYAVQDLRAAYEAFCAGREEATRLESRLRVEAVVAGGYRVGTVSDDELAAAVKAAAVSPRLRVDAARALRRIDLPRAALVVEEAASATADGTLANELREIVASRDDADVDITQTLP